MQTIPHQILVGTDSSVANQSAVDRALQLARGWSARITLQHVVAASRWDDVISTASSAACIDTPSPPPAEAAGADRVVIGAQRAHPAPDLVIGPRRLGTIGRTLLGSVSSGLLQTARRPVIVVPEGS